MTVFLCHPVHEDINKQMSTYPFIVYNLLFTKSLEPFD